MRRVGSQPRLRELQPHSNYPCPGFTSGVRRNVTHLHRFCWVWRDKDAKQITTLLGPLLARKTATSSFLAVQSVQRLLVTPGTHDLCGDMESDC